MNRFSLAINLAFLLGTAGVFLVSFVIFSGGFNLAIKLWQRVFSSWTVRRLQELGMVQKDSRQVHFQFDWKRAGVILLFLILAIAIHDYLLSPLVVVLGMVLIFWIRFQAGQSERSRVNEDAEIAALQLRSLMDVDHSLLNAIKGMDLPNGTLKNAFRELADRLQMHQPPDQAAQPLRALPGKVTARLAVLIASSAHITDEIQSSLLAGLEQEAHRQKLMRSKMRQTLALVRGTIRLLQGVTAAALGFVLLSPIWRSFFLQDVPHRTLVTSLVICAVIASLYFEYEVYQLGSGEAF